MAQPAPPQPLVQHVCAKHDPIYCMFRRVHAGFGQYAPHTRIESAVHTLALCGTTRGEAILEAGDRPKHRVGGIMVMLPRLIFTDVVGDESWHTHWLVVRGPLADATLAAIGKRSLARAIEPVPEAIFNSLQEACRLAVQHPVGWQWSWLRHMAALLEYVQHAMTTALGDEADLVTRARRLMAEHVHTPLPLSHLARRLNVSVSTLSHQFRDQTGSTPLQAYRRARIDRARELLANGMSVTETSEQLGFENPYHFSRLFRRLEGVPPSEFQQRHRRRGGLLEEMRRAVVAKGKSQ